MLIGEIITTEEVFTPVITRVGDIAIFNIDILTVQGTSPTVTIQFQTKDRADVGSSAWTTLSSKTITTSAGATGRQTQQLEVEAASDQMKELIRLRITMGGSNGPLARIFIYPVIWQ